MSLWTISAAPLLIGADVTRLDKAALAVLANAEAIAVDQDMLGLQGVEIRQSNPGLQVIAKRLLGSGRRAVVFLNTTSSPAPMSITWDTLGLQPSATAHVEDVWRRRKSTASFSYTTIVPANDVVMVILHGVEGPRTRYTPSLQPDSQRRSTAFAGVESGQGIHAVQIDYLNNTAQTHIVSVEINGKAITKMAFPPTASLNGTGCLTAELPLSASAAGNTVTFTDSNGTGLALRSMTILAGSL